MQHAELMNEHPEQHTKATRPHLSRERAQSKDWLFHGKDELGREGLFLRIEVTCMHPRRCGPFASLDEACSFLEEFLEQDVLAAFGYMKDALKNHGQACVVESESGLQAAEDAR